MALVPFLTERERAALDELRFATVAREKAREKLSEAAEEADVAQDFANECTTHHERALEAFDAADTRFATAQRELTRALGGLEYDSDAEMFI